MKALPLKERQAQAARLTNTPQDTVMACIPQFAEAEIHNLAAPPRERPAALGAMVFNMERGVYLEETIDFLKHSPDIRPFDVILANELDDGALRSGSRDVTAAIAEALGFNYVFGLEFIELANPDDPKGFHGNAIFSRYPITWAKTMRLPEQYNWYFDRQTRIGGRGAILAKLDVCGQTIGVICAHLENRTDAEGRARQMQAILNAAATELAGLPVILGGDFNTNTFDGRDKQTFRSIAADPALQEKRMKDVVLHERLLMDAVRHGFVLEGNQMHLSTRRKPLPDTDDLLLHLDWLLLRGMRPLESRTISTLGSDLGFAPEGSALARFEGKELSDHNAVWTLCEIPPAP